MDGCLGAVASAALAVPHATALTAQLAPTLAHRVAYLRACAAPRAGVALAFLLPRLVARWQVPEVVDDFALRGFALTQRMRAAQ